MTDPNWAHTEALFNRLVELPANEQLPALERASEGDPALYDAVERLLLAHARDASRVRHVVERAVAPGSTPNRVGETVGSYELTRALGEGGMGLVYLARRTDEVHGSEVAVKVLSGGAVDGQAAERFRAERRILAELNHPGIARLLDGGTTPDGVPYLVMEYIDGKPIDEYCEVAASSTRAKVELLRMVCDAVQFAHGRLVVHRDLKPSNILVDDSGTPKLLDFGIAKLIDQDLDAGLTRTGFRPMTPRYASPEQVRGEAITISTDVYALGVLLYELLTGVLPYPEAASATRALEDAILGHTPTAPSIAITQGNSTKATEDGKRTALSRGLRGDLDTIVLKALHKDPTRRYASVEQLSDDLGRYLSALPVRARPDTLGYRTSKFVQRNRGGVLSGTLALMAITALAISNAVQSIQVRKERDAAAASARESEQVVQFLSSVFEVSDPSESRGQEVTARELLDRGAERIKTELADQPIIQSRLLETLGSVYTALGLKTGAIPFFEDALAAVDTLGSAASGARTERMETLAVYLIDVDQLDRAEALLHETLAAREASADHADARVPALYALGRIHHLRRQFDSAGIYFDQVEQMIRSTTPLDSVRLGSVLTGKGLADVDKGAYDSAREHLTEALAIRLAALGSPHPDIGQAYTNLGYLNNRVNRYAAADSAYAAALEVQRALLEPRHPDIATTLNNRASNLKLQGKPVEAEVLQREALDIYIERYGPESGLAARGMNNLANLRHDQGDLQGALALHERSLAIRREVYGPTHDEVAGSLSNMAAVYVDLGELERAERLYQETLEIDRAALGDEHPLVIADLQVIAGMRTDQGDPEGAVAILEPLLEVAVNALGSDNLDVAAVQVEYGRALLALRSPAEAETQLREGLRVREAALPEDHWRVAVARSLMGQALVDQAMGDAGSSGAQREEGLQLLRQGYEGVLAKLGPDHRLTRAAYRRMER